MNPANKLRQTIIIITVVVAILSGLSFIDSSFILQNHELKRIDLFSDVKYRSIFLHVPVSEKLLTDSIIKIDKLAYSKVKALPDAIVDFGSDTLSALAHFLNSLRQTEQKKKKTRIAYFGDSMIEGDLVTQDLRLSLQDTFGGNGVGFMPITSIVAGFRQTVFHTFSSNWQIYSLLDQSASNHTLGISGYDFVPALTNVIDTVSGNSGSWVRYSAVNRKRLDKFYNVKLFYGNSGEGNYVTAAGQTFPLKNSTGVNELEIHKGYPIQTVQASFQCQSRVNLFGFSFEGDSGVYVDNLSFRGNSGMPLTKIPATVLSGINAQQDYGLVILHYGVNVVSHTVTDFSWYERGMTEVVNHIKAAMPDASILIISTGDKSFFHDGAYVTDPSVPLVIDVQKRVAEKTGVAFWNLYEAMGGYNSMVKWVQGDTVLANKDYTHPNFRGAKKIADMLYRHLMDEYKAYAKKQKV